MAQNTAFSENNIVNIWNKFQKPILTVLAIIVVVLIGFFGYKKLIQEPKEANANTALSTVQDAFQQAVFTPNVDTAALNFIINGNGANKGALYIIKNYSGTKAANLAKYYAGIAYLRLGKYNDAIKYLSDFSTGQPQIQMMAYGSMANAYSELKQYPQAINYYKKASAMFEDDEVNSSEFLFRAASLSEVSGKKDDAIALYKELKEKFPSTQEGMQADKYINRLAVQPNE